MTTPRLYLCYGVPKSGSSLAHALSSVIALRGGFDQSPLVPGDGSLPYFSEDFVKRLRAAQLHPLIDAAERDDRRMVVLKTHGRATPAVREAVANGAVAVQVHGRDPRDVALSMCDAGQRGGAWGTIDDDVPIRTPQDARMRIANQMTIFEEWAALPGALVLTYERTAFETVATARRIAAHMQIDPAPLRDMFAAKSRFTQFNVGRSLRHITEMDPDVSADWRAEFHEVIEAFGLDRPPRRVWPARLMTMLARISSGRGYR
jgi:hypothetical protein